MVKVGGIQAKVCHSYAQFSEQMANFNKTKTVSVLESAAGFVTAKEIKLNALDYHKVLQDLL